jgi:hypothetical protein
MEEWKFLGLEEHLLEGVVAMRELLKLEAEFWCIGAIMLDIAHKGVANLHDFDGHLGDLDSRPCGLKAGHCARFVVIDGIESIYVEYYIAHETAN